VSHPFEATPYAPFAAKAMAPRSEHARFGPNICLKGKLSVVRRPNFEAFQAFCLISGFPLLALPICIVKRADRAHLPFLQDWKCIALPRAAAAPGVPFVNATLIVQPTAYLCRPGVTWFGNSSAR
jgi:hypothetical protein